MTSLESLLYTALSLVWDRRLLLRRTQFLEALVILDIGWRGRGVRLHATPSVPPPQGGGLRKSVFGAYLRNQQPSVYAASSPICPVLANKLANKLGL